MISALLLPMFLAGAPVDRVAPPKDDPAVQLWINNDRRFLPGDRARVDVRAREDGYLMVLHVDPDGYLRVLFPLDPKDDNFVRGGHKYEIRGRANRESFSVDNRYGRGTVYAAVSRDPFHFDQAVLGDHWDYRTLAPNRLPRDPESELNDIVRRMASGSFDYDILSYDVIERVVYSDNYSSSYYGSDYYGYGGCGGYFGCSRPYYGSPYSLSIGLFFGRPYRRFYDPFYAAYDPFYDPFFYDPFYYRPVYRPYYAYPYRYAGYPGNYYQRFPVYNRPYTPYRFRRTDGFAGYRDRRYDLRSVNTVYLPPNTRVREPASSSPVRRVADRTVADQPTGPAVRGTGRRPEPNIDRRPVDRPIEAHRARERVPEQPRSTGSDARSRRNDMPIEIRPPSRDAQPQRDAEPRRDVQPQIERAPSRERDPEPEARPSRREEETGVYRPQPSRGPDRSEVDRGNGGSGGRDQGAVDRGDRGGDSGSSDRGGGSPSGGDRGGGERRGDDNGGVRSGGGDRGGSPPARPSDGGGHSGGGRRR